LIIWGGNYDRIITFPPYFEKDILPWHIKVADRLQPLGKYIITHRDGENHGLMAANAMEAGVELLKPALTSSLTQKTKAKVILGTVYGDLHDIGKNLVSVMLKGTGMEVIDLGINVSTDKFIRCVVNEKPDILALSALLTTTIPQMKVVIDSLEEMGIRDHVKIIVGGVPVTDNFAKSIGADGYAETAGTAAALVRNIL